MSGYQHRIFDSIYVSHNGNVGIGTDNPQQRFHVEGPAQIDTIKSTRTFIDSVGPITISTNHGAKINIK